MKEHLSKGFKGKRKKKEEKNQINSWQEKPFTSLLPYVFTAPYRNNNEFIFSL